MVLGRLQQFTSHCAWQEVLLQHQIHWAITALEVESWSDCWDLYYEKVSSGKNCSTPVSDHIYSFRGLVDPQGWPHPTIFPCHLNLQDLRLLSKHQSKQATRNNWPQKIKHIHQSSWFTRADPLFHGNMGSAFMLRAFNFDLFSSLPPDQSALQFKFCTLGAHKATPHLQRSQLHQTT